MRFKKLDSKNSQEWMKKNVNKLQGILAETSDKCFLGTLELFKRYPANSFFSSQLEEYEIGHIGIMDTTICSANKGNEIIMQEVYRNLNEIFKNSFIFKLPFFDDFDKYALEKMEYCKHIFVGGTNALNSQMDVIRDIGVNFENIDKLQGKVVLMGVGWRRYEEKPNPYTIQLLHKMLSKDVMHSVRDSYAESMLRSIGINNVINTGCPTLWRLNKEHCEQISRKKGKDAIVMFVQHDRKQDLSIMNVVKKNYENIYFWPQAYGDYKYIKTMCPKAICIPPQLEELEKFLQTHENIDYIGTRLHGGIKCLQYKKRAIIIAVDNRAIEMKKDFHLPVVLPEEIERLEHLIYEDNIIDICLPEDKIQRWISQFFN